MASPAGVARPGGPWFDDLAVGDHVDPGPLAPALTLHDGVVAAHRAIVGDRLPLGLATPLATAVTGGPVLPPAPVWDVAIGQSTAFTRRVVANLFYRGLGFHRFPAPGDTLATRTEVVGLRRSRSKPVGMAALRVTTRDQHGRTVLDFLRCAMLPLSDGAGPGGPDDDLDALGSPVAADEVERAVAGWDLTALAAPGPAPAAGDEVALTEGDVVSSAPELARLTLNLAGVHHDARRGSGRRLVYGGHTVGLALSQAARALPGLVTVLAWSSCDHTGPVHEGDTLVSTVTVLGARPARTAAGGVLLDLRSRVRAVDVTDGGPDDAAGGRDVLDWRFTALAASATTPVVGPHP